MTTSVATQNSSTSPLHTTLPKDKHPLTEPWFNNPNHAYSVANSTPTRARKSTNATQRAGTQPPPQSESDNQSAFKPHTSRFSVTKQTVLTQEKKPTLPTVDMLKVKQESRDQPDESKPLAPSPSAFSPQILEALVAGISAVFEKLLDRFKCGAPGDEALPDAALLAIMNAILASQQEGKTTKEALKNVQKNFMTYKAGSIFKELIQVLLACEIDKEFLLENGVSESTFSNDQKEEDSDDNDEMEEEEDDEEWSGGEGNPSKKRKRDGSGKKKSKGDGKSSKRKRIRRSPDKWSPEEDEKLIELVNKYGVNTKKWRAIAEELGTSKNSAKCAQHWRRVLAPNIHKGSWTEDEEEKLLEGVRLYGLTQWTNIAREIPGRTDIQCRYHYIRQKNSREQEWNDEEDDLVRKLVEGYNGNVNWLELSDNLAASKLRRTPRTALECKQRWTLVNKPKGEKQ